MSQHFVPLHLHTDFSLLDGAISLDKLVKQAQEYEFKAIGISDHGNIFGAVKFFQKCKKAGIKPILGMEAYITEDAKIKDANNKYNHLLLLVQNEIGYKNLCKLISFSYQEGFYFKPRIDYNILEKHSEGLIASSACLGGHIPQLLLKDQDGQAEERIDWFIERFGDRFLLEVQPEDQEEQAIVNKKIYELSKKKNIRCIATCDSHYPKLEDHEAHDVMLAIQTHDKVDNPNRYTFGDCRVYIRNTHEMLEAFKDHPECVWATGEIADSCNFEFTFGKLFFPKFEIPQEQTPEEFFTQLCYQGFETLKNQGRIPLEQEPEYIERLELEMKLIKEMGFVGYFLVVSDFIQWAKRNNIPVGPGRGSAAGSLVTWALEITDVDPIRFHLFFERFLNPERITMPDIDIDFCIEGREEVINYVREKYGHDKVCQIITFGTMMAKGAIKDVARALGIPFEDSNGITDMIPDQLKITLTESLEQEPRLQELMDSNPKVKKLFDIAFKLEGLTRHASKHAAGIVISPEPIDEVLPVYVPPKTNELVTQYAMTELESLGFLKIDLLGLKNLTLVKKAVTSIKENHGIDLDLTKIPFDDEKTFQLVCEGKTSGVFQLESDGLKEVLRKLQPEKFEDIIAVNALYRPGPLGSGMVDDFIERRHGRQKITYIFKELEPILKETYGVIVYQEQVMKVASAVAGFTLGEADILRRAMGKKKVEVMAEQREIFLTRAKERNFDAKKAGELFDLMAYFAGYGFNKSHSTAYALIAYQTAYLKANYPAEFMAALISLETSDAEKMAFYLQEAKDMGLKILPPDINSSAICFTVVDGAILFGLKGIKSVGMASLENIIEERKSELFADILNFCKRIDLRTSNKRVMENLICAGAFDKLPGNRAQKFNELQRIIDVAHQKKRQEETGQLDLFGFAVDDKNKTPEDDFYVFQPTKEWPDKEKLEKEKEAIGFYLSSHPLEIYDRYLRWLSIKPFTQLLEEKPKAGGQEPIVTCCGLMKSRKDIITKKGDRMTFLQLEDMSSSAEIIVFPRVFKKVEPWLDSYTVFVIQGNLDAASDRKCKIKANECVPIELFFQEWPLEKATLSLPDGWDEELIKKLQETFANGATPIEFILQENGKKVRLATKTKISLDFESAQSLETDRITVQLTP